MKRLLIAFLIFGILIVSLSIYINNSKPYTNNYIYQEIKEVQTSTTTIIQEKVETASIKFGKLNSKIIMKGSLLKKDNNYDIYTIPQTKFEIGKALIKDEVYYDKNILNSGYIYKYFKDDIYVDLFSNYLINVTYKPKTKNELVYLGKFLNDEIFSFSIANSNLSIKNFKFEYEFDTLNDCYYITFFDLVFEGIPLDKNISMSFNFDEGYVGYYIEKEYVWSIDGKYYIVQDNNERTEVTLENTIDNYCCISAEKFKLNGKYIRFNNDIQ